MREKTKVLQFPSLYPPSDFQGISVNAPNTFPISDLTIVRVGPILSQHLWNDFALKSC